MTQTPEPYELPALHFTTAGPDNTTITHRVDMAAPISLRDRALLRALLSTAYGLLTATEDDARRSDRSVR